MCLLLLNFCLTFCCYGAFMYEMAFFDDVPVMQKIYKLAPFHVIFFLALWSYIMCICTPIPEIPEMFYISPSVERQLSNASPEAVKAILKNFAKNMRLLTCNADGSVRYCNTCKIIRPDRAHHCHECDTCVLKMDHHCPWVNSCVHFDNYKFFVLYIGYLFLCCLYVTIASVELLCRRLSTMGGNVIPDDDIVPVPLVLLLILPPVTGVTLLFFWVFHIYLIMTNCTTHEYYRYNNFRKGGEDEYGFNVSTCYNIHQVFGYEVCLWFLPVYTSLGNGTSFRAKSKHAITSVQEV